MNLSRTPNIDRVIYDAWQDGYVPVNQAFAQAVIDEAAASELPPVVIINDYHLYLVSDYIKRQLHPLKALPALQPGHLSACRGDKCQARHCRLEAH